MKYLLQKETIRPMKSRPTRGAWIEMLTLYVRHMDAMSRPTRGAWIEMLPLMGSLSMMCVAPHTGRVD